MRLVDYIKSVRAKGQLSFTAKEALAALGVSYNAFNCSLYKLRKQGEVIDAARGLYVIVPPEHHNVGCIPAEELMPILMKYWGLPYYVCGLSAAYYHGASHQKPQVFQVMTPKSIKDLQRGKIHVQFFHKADFSKLPIEQRAVKTGYLEVASPELTAYDLLTHKKLSGGVSHVATVLNELVEVMDPEKLILLAQQIKQNGWWQRLGYLLENHIDPMEPEKRDQLVQALRQYADDQVFKWILLEKSEEQSIERDKFWKVIINAVVEVDE